MSVSDVMDHKYNEQLQQEEDLSLFERFQRCDMSFETEDVKAAKENVELGDHLAVHRALLTHHFICTGIEEDKIILHTVKPLCDACHRNPGVKCSKRHEVWTKEYTYQEMEDRNMFKVIWPNILKSRCRDVRDSISLAKTFKDDMDSERFVTSCIYGDSVQLDVKQPFFYMKDVLNSIPVFKNNHKKEYLSKQMLTQSEVPHRNPKEECESIILTSCTCQVHPQEEGLQSFTQGKSSSFCQLLTFKEEKTKSQIAFSSLQGSFESLKHITEEFLSCGYDLVSMTSIYESFKVDGDITNGITYPELEAISEMPLHQQRRWFLLIVDKHQFKNEEISATSPISVGDHIIFKRVRVLGMVRYYHSAIVVDVDEDNISLIEYSAPDHFKWNMVLAEIPMIVRTTKSLKELINEGAKKVNWPEVLQRYMPDQVKKRAEDRLGENAYDLLKNNCEHFASWCKCGLNVSLQVDDWVIMAQTTFYSFLAAIKEHSISSCFQPQVLANISDDLALFIKSSSSLSFIAGIVLEMLLAFYQTYSKYCLSADNKVLKDEQWKAEIHEIWSKGSCRVIGGLIFGCAVGVAIGGPIGAGLGNMMIPLYQWLCQDSDMQERVKTAISQIHQTPTEEYYSEASLQSLQELFDSDCSKVNKDSENSPEEEWLKPIYLLLQSFGVL